MDTYWGHAAPWYRRPDWGIALVRMVVGLTFLMHGWQKLFEMGLPGVTGFFGQLGIPSPAAAAMLVSLLEFVGGGLLLAGLFTRWVSLLLVIDMLVATLVVHLPKGFFVAEGGYELTLLLGIAAFGLFMTGAGAFALDNLLARHAPRGATADRPLDAIRS